jgi:hypothetical protein
VEAGDLRYEGVARSNVALILCKFKRFGVARTEIIRAIECKRQIGLASEPWKSFDILCDIETANGNPEAAHAAWLQARNAYLSYRQQGGYAQTPGG